MEREREREREREKGRQYYRQILWPNLTTKVIHTMSINNIKRPRQWSSLLQYDNKNRTDGEQRTLVMNTLEDWSRKNCFLSAGPRP